MRLMVALIVLSLSGCWHTPIVHPLTDAESWEIAVTPAKIAKTLETEAGAEPVELVIEVPASTKPTHINVARAQRTLKEKFLTNKPAYEVKADNPGVTANQPKKRVWWRWIVATLTVLVFIAALVEAVARRVSNFSPLGIAMKILRGK